MARGPSRQRNAVSFPIRRGHPPKCGAGASVMWRGCLCAPRWPARPQSCAEHERAGPRTGCPHARGAIPGGHHAHALRASRRRMSGAGDRPPVRSTALRGCDAHQGSDPYRGEAYGVAGAGLPRQTPTRLCRLDGAWKIWRSAGRPWPAVSQPHVIVKVPAPFLSSEPGSSERWPARTRM
jgi:hypothetical protein